jgi:hypothetical protein
LTIAAVLAGLAALAFLGDSATATRRELERRARTWTKGPLATLSDPSLLAPDVDLSGQWVNRGRRSHAFFRFTERAPGSFDVLFSTGGCLGRCELTRTAEFKEGVLTLDGAVAEYAPRTYDTLYVIRLNAREYLLPAVSVAEFECELAAATDRWKQYLFTRLEASDARPYAP